MRKFITATFFLAAAYLAVYMGDYSYSYITNDVNGWGVTNLGKNLNGGPGWFGSILVILGIVGIIVCTILIARNADEKDHVSEMDLVGHGMGLLAAAWAFGALVGPFAAWGMDPTQWLQSRLAVFGVICVWPFMYEGVLGLIQSTLEALVKSAPSGSNVAQLRPDKSKSA